MQFYTIHIQGTNAGANSEEAKAVENPGVPGKLNPPPLPKKRKVIFKIVTVKNCSYLYVHFDFIHAGTS